MRTHRSQHRSKLQKIACLIILVIALAVVTPVLAAYLGPDRTRTVQQTSCDVILYECQYITAKGDYRYHQEDSWSCSNESKPWLVYSSQASGCDSSSDGDKYWDKRDSVDEVTITYSPATISGVLQNCALNNGWCTTAARLSLSGNEPVSGYRILAIEGTRNSQNFACTGSTCNVALQEGNNSFTYWALSSWADTSLMGTLSAKMDTIKPSISGTLTATSGSNGWFTSPVIFNGSASDGTSGLAAFTCTLDGIALASCSSITINSEGPHSLVLSARDNAGQTNSLTHNPSIDLRAPALDVSLSGTSGSNPAWYTSAILLGSASDASPGSGLSAFEYRLDQGSWTAFPGSGELTLPDGEHTIDIRATDNAGLTTLSQKEFSLDSVPPAIALEPAGTLGANNWYITGLNLSASASDETSGVGGLEYSLDNEPWLTYTSALDLTDGIHEISFWAVDEAGLASQVNQTYQIDTHIPGIEGNLSGISGENGWFTSDVTISASAFDPQPGSGIDTFTYTLDGSPENPYTTPLLLTDGQHTIQLDARDKAGLLYEMEQFVNIDTIPPGLSIQTALPNWVKEVVTLEGTAEDGGSGLSRMEISTDGGQTWQPVTDTASWNFLWDTSKTTNGPDEVVVRAFDMAGLSSSQTLKTGVDNKAPSISLPDSWFQWSTITLDIQEEHSGLAEARLEISDPQGRWPARAIALDSAAFPIQFKWDRRFADGTTAPEGNYDVKVVAVDNLGNSAVENASVTILLNLPAGPTATNIPSRPSATPTVSYTATKIPIHTATQTVVVRGFGSTPEPQVTATPRSVATSTPRATPTPNNIVEWFESIIPTQSNTTVGTTAISSLEAAPPVTDSGSNVLWGSAAAAVLGSLTAYALEEKRKHEEEQARQAAREADEEERRGKIKAKQMAKLEAKWAQERAWEAAREAEEQRKEANNHAFMEARVLEQEAKEEAAWVAWEKAERERMEEEKAAEKIRTAMAAYSAGRQKAAKDVATPAKTTSKWEKALKWVDDHQTEIALGLGLAVGVAAVVITLGVASPILAAAVVVGAAASSAGGVALGTVALNKHYGREWNTNLVKNAAYAGVTAAAVTGGWFLLHGAMTGVGAFCVTHQQACSRVEPVFNAIDTAEQVSLQSKLAYQTWRGDVEGASQTALDIQMEQFDGGMPGNSIAREIKEEVIDVIESHADETAEILKTYGKDALKLIELYKDDAYDFVKRAEKLGKNPLDILANPPLDGQTLEGWLLNIDDVNNAVNSSLKYNYSRKQIETIRKEFIANPDSKLFSIGYGKGATIPFDKMANNFDGYPMTYLSVPESRWNEFSKARAYGDFWEINSDAIEWGVEERKIFVLNVNYKMASDASDPDATRKFTFAELKLVENPKNNYTLIERGEYSFFVPNEFLDTYKSYLPPELLNP